MSDFHDWERAVRAPGFRKYLLAHGRATGRIKPNGRLPKEDLEAFAYDAITSTEPLFSLEDRLADRGSIYVHCFGDYYWERSYSGIEGPYHELEEAVDTILSIASNSAPEGFYKTARGELSDEFIAVRCEALVELGTTFVINKSTYIRTSEGLKLQSTVD